MNTLEPLYFRLQSLLISWIRTNASGFTGQRAIHCTMTNNPDNSAATKSSRKRESCYCANCRSCSLKYNLLHRRRESNSPKTDRQSVALPECYCGIVYVKMNSNHCPFQGLVLKHTRPVLGFPYGPKPLSGLSHILAGEVRLERTRLTAQVSKTCVATISPLPNWQALSESN